MAELRLRVYYEDTDAAGVVYYANYLRFFERARTEWLRSAGFQQRAIAGEHGIVFVVAEASLRYRRPAHLDDELRILTGIAERHGSFLVFAQDALRGEELLCSGRVKVACVDAERLRPTRLPAAIEEHLAKSPLP